MSLTLAVVSLEACRGVLGIELLSPDPCLAVPRKDETCAGCLHDHCCAELSACASDATCLANEKCAAACAADDPACLLECHRSFPTEGDAVHEDEDACLRADCGDVCAPASGLVSLGKDNPGCQACLGGCLDVAQECSQSELCELALACVAQCRDASCLTRCQAEFPNLTADSEVAAPFFNCIRGCGEACGFAHDFSCSGAYSWFGTSDGSIPFRIQVNDLDAAPIVGARVHFCDLPDCGSCIGDGAAAFMTGNDGAVDVPVAYGRRGCFAMEADGYFPMLFYPDRPITTDNYPNYALVAVRPEQAAPFEQMFGVEYEPGTGALVLRQFDCRISASISARFASSEAGDRASWVYSTDGGVSYGPGMVGDAAIAFNHAPALTEVTTHVDGYADPVSREDVYVLPDTVTVVYLEPIDIE